jgi:hypothetical protein
MVGAGLPAILVRRLNIIKAVTRALEWPAIGILN